MQRLARPEKDTTWFSTSTIVIAIVVGFVLIIFGKP